MIIGMSVATFTLLHVLIRLVAGAVALEEMIAGRSLGLWNIVFLVATAATNITGFFFHSVSFESPHVIGVISIVALSITLFAFEVRELGRFGPRSMLSQPRRRCI
jgi:hypothetical protein